MTNLEIEALVLKLKHEANLSIMREREARKNKDEAQVRFETGFNTAIHRVLKMVGVPNDYEWSE